MKTIKVYVPLWHNHNYRKLILADLCNRFGDKVDMIALSWLIYDVSKNPAYSAINFGVNMLPNIILQPLLGPFVEKRNKKWLLVVSDLCRGLSIFIMLLLYLSGNLSAPYIIFTTFLLSSFESFRIPAAKAILPEILEEENYTIGVSFSDSISKTVELIGLGCAGSIIAIGGMHCAIFIDVASFMISAFILSFLSSVAPIKSEQKEPYFTALKEGFHYLLHNRPLMVLALIASILNAILVPYNSFESVIISDFYQKDVGLLSLISVFVTVFSLIGSFLFPIISEHLKFKTNFICGFLAIASFYIFILLAIQFHDVPFLFYSFIILKCVFIGLSLALLNNQSSVLMMKTIDPAYYARSYAVLFGMSSILTPVLSFTLSFLSSCFSIPEILVFFLIFIFIILFYFLKKNLFRYFD